MCLPPRCQTADVELVSLIVDTKNQTIWTLSLMIELPKKQDTLHKNTRKADCSSIRMSKKQDA